MSSESDPTPHPWRRFLRFSVRGLIVIVIVVGVALGWIVREAHIQRDAVAAIEKAGGSVRYDWESWVPKWLSGRRPRFPGVARARDGYSAVARRHGMASRRRRLASSYFDRILRIARRSSRRCAFCRDSSRR
jgi:hypothetical protein